MNSSSEGFITFEAKLLVLSKVAISVNTIVSLPLNVYVMFLILSRTSLIQDYFSLNLAVSEALYALLSLSYFGFLVPNRHRLVGEIFVFSGGLVFMARPLFQFCICVEYYLGVVHPVFFLRCKPLRYRLACCGVVWLITLTWCLSFIQVFKNLRYTYILFVQNVLLDSVMVFCCVSVLWGLKQPGPSERGPQRMGGDAVKRRAFNIILVFMVNTLMNTIGYIVAVPLQCCLSEKGLEKAWAICTSLGLFTGFTQPLLYLYRAAKLDCCRRQLLGGSCA